MDDSTGPIVVVATFQPKPGARWALTEDLRRFLPLVHQERGCLLYAIHSAHDGTIVMIEKSANRESLDNHSDGPTVAAMRRELTQHLLAPATVHEMAPLYSELGYLASL
jgi:quinol monooxygenase YgiN